MSHSSEAPPPPIILSEVARLPETLVSELQVQLSLSSAETTYADQINSIESNATSSRELTKDDVKPRLLGHWGTTGGLACVYTGVSALIARKAGPDDKFLFVTGPGHGAPAILAALYLEGTITHFYPQYDQAEAGLESFVKAFSWPNGFPSHVNSTTPGAIHEGGELGYALGVAYGSVFDNPDLITVVVVGDGESESGPTAAAWHAHKFLDPKESGAVIPVLHVNGFKISERTIPGTSDNTELAMLYSGYGYQVRFVEYDTEDEYVMGGVGAADRKMHLNLAASLDWAYDEIRKIQAAARSGKPLEKPRFPMIVMRSPKGWTGPSRVAGADSVQLLNNFASHQVPFPLAKTDAGQLESLSRWLKSYRPEDIFSRGVAVLAPTVTQIYPHTEARLGRSAHANSPHKPLVLADWQDGMSYTKGEDVSAMQSIGKYLAHSLKANPRTLRIFSPDELASNKLDAVLDVTTRNFQPDPTTAHKGGRVIEMLSEHTLQAFLQGYTLSGSGRTGVFPSYEAFLGIVATMVVQYSKFAKMAAETNWRHDVASLNYIETSTWTRQEHNGFSHQNVGFISTVLSLPTHLARVYFPPDANTAASVIAHCLKSKNLVNLVVGSKAPTRVFLSPEAAQAHCVAGASVWKDFSIDDGINPDVILVGIGVELTQEVIACANLLRQDFPTLRVRVVNVVDLLIFAPVGEHPHALNEASFFSLFPSHTPTVINYHGAAAQLQGLLFNRPHAIGKSRFFIAGYSEQGSTTTPWSMLRLNGCGRFDLAAKALEMVTTKFNTDHQPPIEAKEKHRIGGIVNNAHLAIAGYLHDNVRHAKYSDETQLDHEDLAKIWDF